MTVRDLIYSIMRLAGVLAEGETPTAAAADDALKSINSMIGTFSINGLLLYFVQIEEFNLVANQQVYTMGVGGNFNTSRPTKILNANIKDGDQEYPMDMIGSQEWAEIQDKSIATSLPDTMYLETSNPLARVYLYPVPDSVKKIVIHSLKPLDKFPSINATIELPPGYEELLKYNGYLRIAPEYGKPIDPELKNLANEATLSVQRQSLREFIADTGLTVFVPRTYNIYEGQ